jgi:hypothetical protein
MYLFNSAGTQILDLRFDHRLITAGKWHHLAFTKKLRDAAGNGMDCAYYLNDALKNTGSNSSNCIQGLNDTSKAIAVGFERTSLVDYCKMDIRGIRVWDQALTAEQVAISKGTRFIRSTSHANELGITANLKVNIPYKNFKLLDYTGNTSGTAYNGAHLVLNT